MERRSGTAVLILLAALAIARQAVDFVGISPGGQRLQHVPRQADPNQWTMLRDASNKQMPRKPPYVDINLLNKVTRMNKEGKKDTIRVYSRQSTIIPAMIGHTCAVHNGRDFVPVVINDGMVGFKIGDFVPTHTFTSHPKQAKVTKYRGR
mmetsp:Transcript_11516/g.14025  ORF Transcript_11516/g.14025 Transcript_11516/m.14025 type:complete len:150 (-) Transcript_11516:51-500(-)